MSNSKSSGGISFLGVLAIVFITLKLCKVIDWSWWWVTCPLCGPAAIVVIFLVGKLAVVILSGLLDNSDIKKRRREQMKRIKADMQRTNDLKITGKSQWQIRMEQMQEAQKKAAELKEKRGY
jgi:hypothetical protein